MFNNEIVWASSAAAGILVLWKLCNYLRSCRVVDAQTNALRIALELQNCPRFAALKNIIESGFFVDDAFCASVSNNNDDIAVKLDYGSRKSFNITFSKQGPAPERRYRVNDAADLLLLGRLGINSRMWRLLNYLDARGFQIVRINTNLDRNQFSSLGWRGVEFYEEGYAKDKKKTSWFVHIELYTSC